MPQPLVIAAAEGAENSFLLPHDFNEVIWGSLAFVVVVGLIVWKGGPAIKNMWNARIDRIRNEVEAAEATRRRAEDELARVQADLAGADEEHARILAEARQTAETLKAQLVARAGTDAEEVRRRGLADVEAAKAQVTSDLSSEVGLLAIGAAEAVVARALDEQAQNELIERYITKVGTQR